MLELHLMGVPEFRRDESPVTFTRRGSVALLAYLVLSRRAHARETLATLLAGDIAEDAARKHLSNILVDLRHSVGDYVIATRQTVAFDWSKPFWLDVAEFESRLSTPEAAEVEPRDTLALYRDEFLAGISLPGAPDLENWVSAEREELRGLYVQALRRQLDECVHKGMYTLGVTVAQRLLAEEPWLEDAHRHLMVMLAQSGRRQAALVQYQTCREVLREDLGADPQPETTALFNRLRAAAIVPANNLPVPSAPMIGRVEELQLLRSLLSDPDCRLVTIAGLGGAGKSRLALQVARSFALPTLQTHEQPFPDGIISVSLAEHSGSSQRGELSARAAVRQLTVALADALGLPSDDEAAALAHITTHLHLRAVLLVLDNLEPIEAGAAMLVELLARAPHVRILATSRTPLHVTGERVLHLDGLRLPADERELAEAEASALFIQEARRVDVTYRLSVDDRPFLVDLCRLVGGFPLAILLAARWAPVLPCSVLVAEIENGLDVLTTSEPDLPERHRSLAAILDSALASVPNEDDILVRSIAAERTLRDGGAVATTEGMHATLLPRLRLLRERSLVSIEGAGQRVQPHPLLRPYFRGRPRAQPVHA